MNMKDYSKFLTKTKESPLNNNIVDKAMLKEINALQVPIPHKQQNNLNHDLSLNTKAINRYNSTNRLQSKDGTLIPNKTDKGSHKHNSFINLQSVGGYLNRRHVQELERLKKYKEEREKKEREEFSFKPKISTKSKTIAKTLINDNQSLYTNHNISDNVESNTKHSRSYIDNSIIGNDKTKHRNQSTNDMNDLLNIKNSSTCYDKENIVKYKLDIEAKEYVLERMKIIRDNYYMHKK